HGAAVDGAVSLVRCRGYSRTVIDTALDRDRSHLRVPEREPAALQRGLARARGHAARVARARRLGETDAHPRPHRGSARRGRGSAPCHRALTAGELRGNSAGASPGGLARVARGNTPTAAWQTGC